MFQIFMALACLICPYLILKFEKRVKLIEWLSPIVCCYAVGITFGNIFAQFWSTNLARTLSEVSVLFALPMLLYSVDFFGWFKLAKTTIISFALLIVCVCLVSFVIGYYYRHHDPEVWKMAGMLVGVYVGGTANLTAIGKILGVRDEAFIMLNAVDVAIGGVYLLIVLSVGVKLLTKVLPAFNQDLIEEKGDLLLNWNDLTLKSKIFHSFSLVVLTGIIIGVSVFGTKWILGSEVASVIILSLTSFALLLSTNRRVRHFKGSQEVGNYFLMVFCFAVGSLANVNQLISGSLWYFWFCGLIMFGSIILHFSLCYLLKIDRDTAIITSMAGIFGPAFVAPMAQVLKNKAILVSGVTTALMGIAVGNFFGVMIGYLIERFI